MSANRSIKTFSTATLLLLASVAAHAQDTDGTRPRVQQVTGFSAPEAVRYDPDQDVFFVSNFNGDPSGDSNAFVSKVSAEGEILDLKFMIGTDEAPFHGGRGMYIQGDGLWVADAGGLHRFDRRSGAHLEFVDFSALEPGFLNDIVLGADDNLYVTDTGTSRIYRVADGKVTVAADTPFRANGITLNPNNGRLLLAPWEGSNQLVEWDPETGRFHTLVSFDGGGNYDGIEVIGATIVAASQADRRLHLIRDGRDRGKIDLGGEPADIGFDTRRQRAAVPYVALDRVDLIDWFD